MYYWTARFFDEEFESFFSDPTGFSISQSAGGGGEELPDHEYYPVEDFNSNAPREVRQGPILFPGQIRPVNITYEVVDGLAIFEGDILLGSVNDFFLLPPPLPQSPSFDPQGIGLRPTAGSLWPNGVMPYVIDGSLSPQQQVIIMQAMQHLSDNTSLSFTARSAETDYVEFQAAGGCSSYVGRIGGKQEILLHPLCGFGSTVHEILHAAGVFHEQSRCDRDSFVTIAFANIEAGRENNFQNACTAGSDIDSYDFGSLMHYPATAFSVNDQPTILTNPPNTPIGQRDGLSAGDINTVQTLYGGGTPQPPAGNNPPTVTLSASPLSGTPSDTITLIATGQDPDGDPLVYEWFLNGAKQVVNSPNVKMRNPPVGIYDVVVRVSDGNGGTGQSNVTINVGNTPLPPDPGGNLSIEQALDFNDNTFIDDNEIIKAIEYWILGEIIPNTGGQVIGDNKILDLITLWILGLSYV
jgi:hypothetical protein